MTVLDALNEAASEFGVSIVSAEVVPVGVGLARLTVELAGVTGASEKAAVMWALQGEDVPGIGKVLSVRPEGLIGGRVTALLDIEAPVLTPPPQALSPFGGPMKVAGPNIGWLIKRGYPVPGIWPPQYPFEYVPHQAPR